MDQYVENMVKNTDFDIDMYIVRSFSDLDRPMSSEDQVEIYLQRLLTQVKQKDINTYRRQLKQVGHESLKKT